MKKFIQYLIGTLAAVGVVALSAHATTLTPRQISDPQTLPVKGDLYVVSSTSITTRIGVGANGKCLTASSTAPYGISWETCSSGGSGITSLGGVSTSSITLNGTTNQVNIASSSNSITFSLPQSINTSANVTFGSGSFTNTLNASGTPVVLNTRAVNTGTGLTGGGNLSADRTISLNINSGSTQTCAGNNKVSAITATGTVTCSTDQTGTGLKLPTITVASSSADYPTLAAAVLAASNVTNFPDGALLYLPDPSYSVTTTLSLPNGINIVGNPHQTTINFTATVTGSATSTGSVLFQASGTTPGNIGLSNLILNQNGGGYKGTALDLSNMALTKVNNIQSLGFKYGIWIKDTANNTFYNNITNWASFDDNCIYASSTNPVNDNTFVNIRCGFNSGNNPATSTTYGLYLNNGQDNNFYNFNAEPAHPAGTIGVDLQTANALSNSFFGLYAEANATSVLLSSGTANNSFFGGQVCCHTVTSISDSGNRNIFLGLNDNFTGLASSTIPAPLFVKDYSSNALTNLFQDNTTFAHINSSLVTVQLQNGTDTSKALQVKNAGTGASLSVENNSGSAKFQVGNTTATSSVNFTVTGANTSLATTTITSGGLSVATTTAPTNGSSALFRQNSSSTVYIGGASSAGCLALGDSANGASVVYITATGSTLSATTTKPLACR